MHVHALRPRVARKLFGVVAICGSLAAVTVGSASAASALHPTPTITGVVWSGSHLSPTVTVNGSLFGSHAPAGVAVSSLSNCSPTLTGTVYKPVVIYDDTAFWSAGHESTPTLGNCIGWIVSKWTATQIVFTFGSAYTTHNWVAANGDNFAINIKGYDWGGLISGLS